MTWAQTLLRNRLKAVELMIGNEIERCNVPLDFLLRVRKETLNALLDKQLMEWNYDRSTS